MQDLLRHELEDKPEIERKLPKSFLAIHKLITEILRDNNILVSKEDLNGNKLELIVDTVMRLQKTLLLNNTKNKEEIKAVINSMKPEIAHVFDPAMQQEVTDLLHNLSGMTEIIQANFSQIKDILQNHQDEVIKAITY